MLGTSPLLGQALPHAWDMLALGTGPSACLGHARSWERPFNVLGTCSFVGQALQHASHKPALGTGPSTCLEQARSWGLPGLAKLKKREKSWDLLMCLENALRQVTGAGFERFTGVEGIAKDKDPLSPPIPPPLRCVVLRKVVEIDLCYGLWQGGAWWTEMVDAASEISSLFDPSDRLFMHLWPQVCLDLEYHSEDQQDEAARILFLQNRPHCLIFEKKLPRVAISRWFSFTRSDVGGLRSPCLVVEQLL